MSFLQQFEPEEGWSETLGRYFVPLFAIALYLEEQFNSGVKTIFRKKQEEKT